jgi:hypothetical protein
MVLCSARCTFPLTPFDLRYASFEVILMSKAETARWFGSDVSASAIQQVVSQIIRPYIKQIGIVLDAGGDPKDVDPAGFTWAPRRKGPKGQKF